jgi:hypothetical protein
MWYVLFVIDEADKNVLPLSIGDNDADASLCYLRGGNVL